MKTRPWYRVWPEVAGLCFGWFVIPRLPRPIVVALAAWMGRLACFFSRKLRRVAIANLDLVFGASLSKKEKAALLKSCFRHFSLLVLDILWFSRKPAERLEAWVKWDESTDLIFQSGAQLMLASHYGNWETMGLAYAAKGQPLMSVATPLKNPKVDRFFIRLRQQTGQIIIPRRGAVRKLLQGLRSGNKMAVLLDQNTSPRQGGVFVDFFGRPVPVSSAPAGLAVTTGTPVFTVLCTPDRRGRYTVRLYDSLTPDPAAADPVADLTGRMTRSMEKVIRDQPEYWCWMYKRWKYIPPGADPADFPFYAKSVPVRDIKPAALSER